MKKFLKSLFSLLALVVLSALSADLCTEYKAAAPGYTAQAWVPTKAAACEGFRAWMAQDAADTGAFCTTGSLVGGFSFTVVQTESVCQVTKQCSLPGTAPAQYYASYQSRTVECGPQCQQGQTADYKVRIGWASYASNASGAAYQTEDGRHFLKNQGGESPPPSTLCDGTCEMVLDGAAGQLRYNVTPTASGLHAITQQQGYMKTGGTCTSKSTELNADAVGHCDGSVGQINGQTVCIEKGSPTGVGVAGASPSASAVGSTGGDTPVNNPNGQSGNVGPNGEQPGKGGDKAGVPDFSGTGIGTPGDKDENGNPTGTIGKPGEGKEQAACGAPGQPPCRIDESGTPTNGASRFGDANANVDQTRDGVLDAILQHKELTAPAWSWTFQLPTGCTPLHMEAFNLTLDICQWQEMFHDLMSMVWAAATIWFSIAIVGRTLGGS